jgi:hypothetical protein
MVRQADVDQWNVYQVIGYDDVQHATKTMSCWPQRHARRVEQKMELAGDRIVDVVNFSVVLIPAALFFSVYVDYHRNSECI